MYGLNQKAFYLFIIALTFSYFISSICIQNKNFHVLTAKGFEILIEKVS